MQGSISFDGTLAGSIAGGGGGGTTPVISADATVDSLSEDPTCTVSRTGTDETPTFHFAFSGIVGEEGPQGPAGVGVPSGGSSGDVLRKNSATNYDTYWDNLTALDIPYDNTTSGMTATDVQAAVTELKSNLTQLDGLNVVKRITTPADVISFSDGSNLPIYKLLLSIEPIQEGSGDPSPENIRPISGHTEANVSVVGKNWLSMTVSGIKALNTEGTWNGNSYLDYGVTFNLITDSDGNILRIDASGSATNGNSDIYLPTMPLVDNQEYILTGCPSGGSSSTYRFVFFNSNLGYKTDLGKGINFDYISGSNQTATIRVFRDYSITNTISFYPMIRLSTESSDFAPYNGQTYNIEFKDGSNPLTVYGGTLDVVSGVLRVTDGHIASYNNETLPSTWISDRDVYAEGTTPTIGAEVVYKLATPLTYQLTPTQVKSLLGVNNVWADAGDILEVDYTAILNFS